MVVVLRVARGEDGHTRPDAAEKRGADVLGTVVKALGDVGLELGRLLVAQQQLLPGSVRVAAQEDAGAAVIEAEHQRVAVARRALVERAAPSVERAQSDAAALQRLRDRTEHADHEAAALLIARQVAVGVGQSADLLRRRQRDVDVGRELLREPRAPGLE